MRRGATYSALAVVSAPYGFVRAPQPSQQPQRPYLPHPAVPVQHQPKPRCTVLRLAPGRSGGRPRRAGARHAPRARTAGRGGRQGVGAKKGVWISDLMTVSAIPDKNLNPGQPFASSAGVLLPHTEATRVADAMIEAWISFYVAQTQH
jgi:hypothetical protein